MVDSTGGGPDGAEAAVFRYSRNAQMPFLVAVLLGAGAVAFMVYDQPQPAIRWGGLGLSVVLAAVSLFFMFRPFDPARYADHTLTIDREGIACALLYDRKVPWDAISYATIQYKENNDLLVVGVHDPKLYPPAGGKLRRAVSVLETLNSASMDVSPLEGTASDIDAALDRFGPWKSATG